MKKIFPLVLISIGVAMISVLSQFTIPFGPIPLTLQTLMIGIIGTNIKPIAPDTKRRALLRRLAKKIVTRLDLALVNRDVIHARNGKKRRKPAVGPRKCEAPPAPPANTGKPKKPKSR